MNLRKWAGRFGAMWVVLAVLVLAGCASDSPKTAFSPVAGGPTPTAGTRPSATGNPDATSSSSGNAPATPVWNSGMELLKVGDLLIISYLDTPSQLPPFDGRIKEDGTITLFFNEPFTAAGKTVTELEKEIRARYVPSKYKYMTVKVDWQPATRFYYVGGEVKSPGSHPYVSRIKILEAIQSAGDFTEYARKGKVRLTRANGEKLIIDCKKAKTHPELNVEVFPDDRIDVPKSPL
jgi:polysaccharide export outer membrane protein